MTKLLLVIFAFAAIFNAAQIELTATAADTINRRAQIDNQMQRCTVNDPTGTALNVRDKPNGKRIVGKLKNNARVFADNYAGDAQDRAWAEVRLKNDKKIKPLGWVLQEYLDCE